MKRKRTFRKVAARVCGRIGMQNAPSAEPAAIEVSRFESKAMASSYSAMDVSDKVEDPEGPILTLWCSGDAPDSAQQHNFEGVWTLHRNRVHRRPVYEHIAPDGTPVYLYSVEQSAGTRPRWIIGPSPDGGGANGWAFSDSNASRPEEINQPWQAWIKDLSAWGELWLAFSEQGAMNIPRSPGDFLDDDDDDMMMASPAGEEAGAAEQKKKKKTGGTKKKAAAKGTGAGKAKKGGGEGKSKATKPKANK